MAAARSIFRLPHRVEAFCRIAEEIAEKNPAAARTALGAALELAAKTDRKDAKEHMLGTISRSKTRIAELSAGKTAGGIGKEYRPLEAVKLMESRGEFTHAQITDWSDQALTCSNSPELENLPAYLKTLQGKTPAEASGALARAARNLGDALTNLRNHEAHWQLGVKTTKSRKGRTVGLLKKP